MPSRCEQPHRRCAAAIELLGKTSSELSSLARMEYEWARRLAGTELSRDSLAAGGDGGVSARRGPARRRVHVAREGGARRWRREEGIRVMRRVVERLWRSDWRPSKAAQIWSRCAPHLLCEGPLPEILWLRCFFGWRCFEFGCVDSHMPQTNKQTNIRVYRAPSQYSYNAVHSRRSIPTCAGTQSVQLFATRPPHSELLRHTPTICVATLHLLCRCLCGRCLFDHGCHAVRAS